MSLLLLLLALAVIAGIAAVAAGVVAGGMDDPTTSVPVRALPPGPVRRADVTALRFVPAVRGYRMAQVDAAMDRLGDEIERLHEELAERDRRLAGPTTGSTGSGTGRAAEFDPAPVDDDGLDAVPAAKARENGAGESGAGESGAGESGAGENGTGENGTGESKAAETRAAEPARVPRAPEPGDPTGGAV